MKLTTFPIIKDIWSKIRRKKISQKHQEVAAFWEPIIDDYFPGNIEHVYLKPKKPELLDKKIIWQYWGQGIIRDNLPEIIQIRFDSVDKYKGDYEVIRLSDDTIKDYIDLPDFVFDKRNNSAFNRTFFSDLLRLALLKTYGGVWLDATVFLSGSIPKEYFDADYFVYQRDNNEPNKKYWESTYAYYWGWYPDFKVRMLNSIFFAHKGSNVVSILFDLMMFYWKTHNDIIDYFFFQILYNELIKDKLNTDKCMLVSDVNPHYLQTKINGGCDFISFNEIFKTCTIHKMSYFDDKAMKRFRENVNL